MYNNYSFYKLSYKLHGDYYNNQIHKETIENSVKENTVLVKCIRRGLLINPDCNI